MLDYVKKSDSELSQLIHLELERQKNSLEMIASESIVPVEIMELSGCCFTNKTLEGYPNKRFQTGAEIADKLENLGIDRANQLFEAEHVNLQPYSGSISNYCVYKSILKPLDRVLSMRLDHGGHLSHGSKANFISELYSFYHYGVNPSTEEIDYLDLEHKAKKIQPKLIVAGGSAYPRLIDYERIAFVAKKNNAFFMVDMAHISGLVAARVIPSPVPYADFVTSSTTKTISGPRSGLILCKKKYSDQLDRAVFPGVMGSMHLHTMAAKAWLFKYCLSSEFRNTMKKVLENSQFLSKELLKRDFKLVSNGTDTHLILINLTNTSLTGKEFEKRLAYVGINTNKNQIPNDMRSPLITSGLRIGLTSLTERGLNKKELVILADIFKQLSQDKIGDKDYMTCRQKVELLLKNHPLYSNDILNYIS